MAGLAGVLYAPAHPVIGFGFALGMVVFAGRLPNTMEPGNLTGPVVRLGEASSR